MYPVFALDAVTGLESVSTVLTAVWGGIGSVVDTISGKPLLLIPLGVVVAGGAIGLAKGLMGTRRKRR